ncbi:MAG TPA: acyl-CoA dehydrogenase family protein [Mycobacteriales bacterium]|nr:acyl-CoA dehydrogenase family protein [Mycobacteriales bacterium]
MDFTFTADQQDLRRALADVSADHCGPEQVRAAIAAGAYDADLARLLSVELGLAGFAVGEAAGGAGGSFVDAAVVIEEAGAALWPAPITSAVVGAVVLDRSAAPDALVASVASGDAVAIVVPAAEVGSDGSVLSGTAEHVVDGHRADVLVVATPDGLWWVDSGTRGVTVGAGPSLDLTRWHATVTFDRAAATRIGDPQDADRAIDLLRVALSVEAVGVGRHCLASTVNYLKTRVQFGKPIGSFQALQHRCADLAVALEAAASTAYYAAWAAAASPAELPVVAPLAKAVCTDSAYRIASETIQLHGGIGFTWEHEAHLYFKRATALRLVLGDAHEQRRVVAERAGLK